MPDQTERVQSGYSVFLTAYRCTSGCCRSQATRLVGRWESNLLATVPLAKLYGRPTVPFARKYTSADIELLAEMDRANEDACRAFVGNMPMKIRKGKTAAKTETAKRRA